MSTPENVPSHGSKTTQTKDWSTQPAFTKVHSCIFPRPDRAMEIHDQDSESVKACAAIMDNFLTALNARDFSFETWAGIAPNARFSWGVLNWQRDNESDLALADWLEAMRAFARKAPNYHFERHNITMVVDETAGTAECLMNIESTGVYPGIVREAVAGAGFVRRDGKWECIRHGAYPGPSFG